MPKTIQSTLTDAAIKRHFLTPEVTEIKDTRHPVRLRINQGRTKGTWYVVTYSKGKARWRKVGHWPSLSCKALFSRLPDILATIEADPELDVLAEHEIHSVRDLLNWYQSRSLANRSIGKSRKNNLKSCVKNQLMPTIGTLMIDQLDKATIDERMMWPLQQKYKLSTVRQAWRVIKAALKRARELKLIESDPMASSKFTDHITVKVNPKGARIKPHQINRLVDDLEKSKASKKAVFLFMLLLMHGTRIGETRQARWEHISMVDGYLHIPPEITKTKQEISIPLTEHSRRVIIKAGWKKGKTGYIFPSTKSRRLCVSARTASSWIRSISNADWSAHDLRKLARSIWMDQGTDYMVCEFLLNHKMSGLNKTYIHTQAYLQMEECLKKYHSKLEKIEIYRYITKT